MLLQMVLFHSFYSWVIFHCIYVPHLLYPLLCWWNLDCFHVLAIVNCVQWIGCMYLFELCFSLVICSGGGSDGKASACNAEDPGSIPGLGRSPGEGNGNPLQYSCLENSMDGGAWWATVHGVTKSLTGLSDFTFTLDGREWRASRSPCVNWLITAEGSLIEKPKRKEDFKSIISKLYTQDWKSCLKEF